MKKLIIIFVLFFQFSVAFSQCSTYQVQLNSTDVSCNGSNDGVIEATPMGGVSPFSFYWGGPSNFTSSDSIITNLSPGQYSLTVVDANNCQSISAFSVINEPTFILQLSADNVSCFGGADGEVIAFVTGGVQPITYSWTNTTQNTSIITNLSTGNYALDITDNSGCQKQGNITVTEPDSLYILLDTIIPVSCNGGNTGFIKVDPSGGTGTYNYLWTGPNNYINPNPTKQLANLYAGIYNLTITDQNNCQSSISMLVEEPVLLVENATVTDVSCFGFNDGLVSTNVFGGVPPYSYLWGNGEVTNIIDSLLIGNYSVVVTDSNNCTAQSNYIINQPDSLTLSLVANDVSCFGLNNGSIDVSVDGGTTPFSYSWSNGEITQDISLLNQDSYSVLVTDYNNCSVSDSAGIIEPDLLQINIDSIVHLSCFNDSSALISVSCSGGLTPYIYQWSDDTITSSFRDGLSVGNYVVNVTDSNNCLMSQSIQITEPDAIEVSYQLSPHLCYNDSSGSLDILNITGGTGTYSLAWSNGFTFLNLTNLFQDTLELIVIDSLLCSSEFLFLIPSPDSLAVSFIKEEISCTGVSDGSLTAITTGGVGGYIYSWSTNDSTPFLDSLAQGTYYITVSDSNGCMITSSTGLSFPNPVISVISNNISVSCNGGSDGVLEANSSGGTPPFSYLWSNGDTTSVADSLQAGSYSLTISDDNGCQTQISTSVSQPSPYGINPLITTPSCFNYSDGSIELNVTGGTPPYNHNWSNGDTVNILFGGVGYYTDTIFDANNCTTFFSDSIQNTTPIFISTVINDVSCYGISDGDIELFLSGGAFPYTIQWSNGSNQSAITNLVSAMYVSTILDANNCELTDTFFVNQPSSLISLSNSVSPPTCYNSSDGTINILTIGGSPPYQLLWDDGDTSSYKQNVIANTYIVNVSDINGCIIYDTINVNAPDSITVDVISDSVSCFGGADGAALLIPSGGTFPYTFEWYNGLNISNLTSLSVGVYSFEVRDSNNCIYNNVVNIFEPADLQLSLFGTNLSCFGINDGSIVSTTVGGILPYSYLWSNGDTTLDAQNLSDGLHSLIITDANNCSITQFEVISEPSLLNASINHNNVDCYGNSNGSIDLSVNGGVQPYIYNWSNGASTQDVQNMSAGAYSVEIYDANNCLLNMSDSITEPSQILIEDSINNVECANSNNGSIYLDVTGGVSPFNFVWSSGQNTEDIFQLSPNQYSVLIIDANGCTTNYSNIIEANNPISFTDSVIDESCFGASNGQVFIEISGGVSPYEVDWLNGDFGTEIDNLTSGTHAFIITDSVMCMSSFEVELISPDEMIVEFEAIDVSCASNSDGEISLNISGGVLPYSINWSNGLTDSELANLTSGVYVLLLSDNNSCELRDTVEVFESADCFIIPSVFTPNNDGVNDIWEIKNDETLGNYQLQIIDENGLLLLENTESMLWDGTFKGELVKPNTYYYIISKENGELISGSITLIR